MVNLPTAVLQQAMTLALYYVAMVFIVSPSRSRSPSDIVFEAVSALGPVGCSAASTLTHGSASHTILILAMIFGGFSPLLLVLYMSRPRKKPPFRYPADSVRLG
ncbi:MAG: hypothetical protein ACKVVT_17360 [Dehalococcoidia bacterium]